jgi:hypothetical protein
VGRGGRGGRGREEGKGEGSLSSCLYYLPLPTTPYHSLPTIAYIAFQLCLCLRLSSLLPLHGCHINTRPHQGRGPVILYILLPNFCPPLLLPLLLQPLLPYCYCEICSCCPEQGGEGREVMAEGNWQSRGARERQEQKKGKNISSGVNYGSACSTEMARHHHL